MMPQWSNEQAERARKRVAKEADRAAGRLGAHRALLIAFFMDKDGMAHMIDAGSSPIPIQEVYERLLSQVYYEEQKKRNQQELAQALESPVPQ